MTISNERLPKAHATEENRLDLSEFETEFVAFKQFLQQIADSQPADIEGLKLESKRQLMAFNQNGLVYNKMQELLSILFQYVHLNHTRKGLSKKLDAAIKKVVSHAESFLGDFLNRRASQTLMLAEEGYVVETFNTPIRQELAPEPEQARGYEVYQVVPNGELITFENSQSDVLDQRNKMQELLENVQDQHEMALTLDDIYRELESLQAQF